ncbi:MAG: hypothetical protein KGQ41_02930 [Alphaproteobacteria bacterium]|nr:hypothetical protein [Alphaproteobacteria bacterium]
MRRLALVALLIALPAVALAKGPEKIEIEPLMPAMEAGKSDKAMEMPAPAADDGKPLTAEDQALMICQTADIMGEKVKSAEYQAGVDAYGNPVAPADVYNNMPFEVPEQIQVPIAVDVMKALGINATEGKATIGTLTVNKGGQLLYNGKDITNTVEGYCREHTQKMEGKK